MEIVMFVKTVKSSLINKNVDSRDGFEINPYDMYALKDVLKQKEQVDTTKVTCMSMAARSAESVLIKCLAMGVDDAILLCDPVFGGADTVATSYVLVKALESMGSPSLIVCGGQSVDGETGQIPYSIAKRLRTPCVANVKKILELSDEEVVLETVSEEYITRVKVKLPVVICYHDFVVFNENVSLMSIKKAQKKGVTFADSKMLKLDKEKCGVKGSKTRVLNVYKDKYEGQRDGTVFVNGTSSEKADFIHKILKKKGVEFHEHR